MMNEADKKRLEQILKRLRAATPGPWQYFPHVAGKVDDLGHGYILAPVEAPTGKTPTGYIAEGFHKDEAEFCAHAREDVEWLLKKLEEMEEDAQ